MKKYLIFIKKLQNLGDFCGKVQNFNNKKFNILIDRSK